MPIDVRCASCDTAYRLKDEYAGRKVKCPKCASVLEVPAARPASAFEVVEDDDRDDQPADDGFPPDLAEAFRRDKFLLRQKLWSIKEKYTVGDEDGDPVLWVERPAHLGKALLALMAGIPVIFIAGGVGAFVGIAIGNAVEGPRGLVGPVLAGLFGLLGFVLGLAVIIQLYPRRHITFYADKAQEDPLMRAFQDQKWVFVNQWYTLADDTGAVLCRFRKNFLHGILRRRWYVHGPDGEVRFVVKEDSLILSLLRRSIGYVLDEIPLLGLALAAALRTNFIYTRVSDGKVLGEFNRRLTFLDRYVLDLTEDEDRELDRRVAVAMGVLLDTGERR